MNLVNGRSVADYIHTGEWSKKSIKEAKKYCTVNVAASAEDRRITNVPAQETWKLGKDPAYIHVCTNETIGGVEYQWTPDTGAVPLVADMSSHILSRPLDIAKYGVIYGGAQKNIGPAGLTIVIVRDDLIGQTIPGTPSLFDSKAQAEHDSMVNTPPTYAWYVAGLVFQWLKAQGGLEAMAQRNQRKAKLLYDAIDQSGFYNNPVDPDCRSWMNVVFTLANAELDKTFLAEARKAGLLTLSGHRSVGGMRASIYNAMPEEGVKALVDFMQDFARRNG
jgi:phosphoserine aminotransferase